MTDHLDDAVATVLERVDEGGRAVVAVEQVAAERGLSHRESDIAERVTEAIADAA